MRFKVFVETRIAEIQELTYRHSWRYVNSLQNPADDITRGKTLQELSKPNRWSQGPPFLLLQPEQWPANPVGTPTEPCDPNEFRKETFCGVSTAAAAKDDSYDKFNIWKGLLEATALKLHGAADREGCLPAETYRQAEIFLLKRPQQNSFPEEYGLLNDGRPVRRSSRLIALAPEFDKSGEVIRVGGCLRHSEDLAYTNLQPFGPRSISSSHSLAHTGL